MAINWLRNWLLGIVKQAVREVNAERGLDGLKYDSPPANTGWVAAMAYPQRMTMSEAAEALQSHPEVKRSTPRYPDSPPTASFEQLQDEALTEQDAWWKKQMLSDV